MRELILFGGKLILDDDMITKITNTPPLVSKQLSTSSLNEMRRNMIKHENSGILQNHKRIIF